ncbi:hypothetical protein niasHT_006860 [Heterodera trifolii]|uniref:Uncharacterized protein n=1 Tax=Heterodera trifolii TaxID=157864 RepID=A0ABD2LMP4_9BILA
MRPQRRRLRPIQLFQLVLLSLFGILLFAKVIYKTLFSQEMDSEKGGIVFFAIFMFIIIILCIREVYKGSHGQKWHFHGICALTLLLFLLYGWYYGLLKHEPAISAIWAGIMCEFFAYIALNKILSVVEEHRIEELVNETNKSVLDVNEQS